MQDPKSAPGSTAATRPGRPAGGAATCLVTGASGYVGGRLVPELLAAGHRVRCLARSPDRLRQRPWADQVEIVRGDVTDAESLAPALADVEVAYYLVHALASGRDFEQTDRHAAHTFGAQARRAGVRRLVYLGGLTPAGVPEAHLSPHLRSRAEVGRILLDSGVPTVVLRAAVVLGSGSVSFEMLRHLTERLPVMVAPRWVRTRLQPIAVQDALRLLVGCAGLSPDVHGAFDIGGPEVVSYVDMMRRYAAVAGLPRRLVLTVPALTPGLSSHWIGLVTPVPAAIARPLTESLRHEMVCQEHELERYLPSPPGHPLGFDRAVALALQRVHGDGTTLRRSAAHPPGDPGDPLPTDPPWAGGSLCTDERTHTADVSPEALWQAIESLGGEHGRYPGPVAWSVRGWLDRLVGTVVPRRDRRAAHRPQVGDTLGSWQVEEVEPGRLLRLRTGLHLPGPAWLELRVDPAGDGAAQYRQRAVFHPRGLLGHLYWWSVAPFHPVVFDGMARAVVRAAARAGPGQTRSPAPVVAAATGGAVASPTGPAPARADRPSAPSPRAGRRRPPGRR